LSVRLFFGYDFAMSIERKEVEHLALLSRIGFSDVELARMEETLDPILAYVGRLSKVDVQGAAEYQDEEPGLGLRADVPSDCEKKVQYIILENFPDKLGDALRVPGVFENPKG